MATVEQNTHSDEIPEYKPVRCSLCTDEGALTLAQHYCVDCKVYYCRKCLTCHNKMPTLKSHKVNTFNTANVTDVENIPLPTEPFRCTIHPGKPVDQYCNEHDELCCGSCAAVKHRQCRVDAIIKVARNFKYSQEVGSCKVSLVQVNKHLVAIREKRTERAHNMDRQKHELIESIDRHEEHLIMKINKLANNSRAEIRRYYDYNTTRTQIDDESLNAVIATTSEYVAKLELTDDGPLLFSATKTSKTVIRDGRKLLLDMTNDLEKSPVEIKYKLNNTVQKHTSGMKSLGQLEECFVTGYWPTSQNTVSLMPASKSLVYDVCLLDTNDLIVTYFNECIIRRFNSDFQLLDEIAFPGSAIAVSKTKNETVAVRSDSKRTINFVSVGQEPMQLMSVSFPVADGLGMTYDSVKEELYVCENHKISVYSVFGEKLRTYPKYTKDKTMFAACRQIALIRHEATLHVYVTDAKCVVVLDKTGAFLMRFSIPEIPEPWALCVLPGPVLLVGCCITGTFKQTDKSCALFGKLIHPYNGGKDTYFAVYDRYRSRLIVGGKPSVLINTLSPK